MGHYFLDTQYVSALRTMYNKKFHIFLIFDAWFLYQEFGCKLPERLNRSLDQASTPSDQGCGSGSEFGSGFGVFGMIGSGYFERNRIFFRFSSEGLYPDSFKFPDFLIRVADPNPDPDLNTGFSA